MDDEDAITSLLSLLEEGKYKAKKRKYVLRCTLIGSTTYCLLQTDPNYPDSVFTRLSVNLSTSVRTLYPVAYLKPTLC